MRVFDSLDFDGGRVSLIYNHASEGTVFYRGVNVPDDAFTSVFRSGHVGRNLESADFRVNFLGGGVSDSVGFDWSRNNKYILYLVWTDRVLRCFLSSRQQHQVRLRNVEPSSGPYNNLNLISRQPREPRSGYDLLYCRAGTGVETGLLCCAGVRLGGGSGRRVPCRIPFPSGAKGGGPPRSVELIRIDVHALDCHHLGHLRRLFRGARGLTRPDATTKVLYSKLSL